VLDYDGDDDTQWYDTITDMAPEINPMFNEFGNIHQTLLINRTIVDDYLIDTNQELEAFIIPTKAIHCESHERSTIQREPDYPRLGRFFGYLSADIVNVPLRRQRNTHACPTASSCSDTTKHNSQLSMSSAATNPSLRTTSTRTHPPLTTDLPAPNFTSAPRHRFVTHMDAKQTANSSAHSRKMSAAVSP
jgi:hypothetical protein